MTESIGSASIIALAGAFVAGAGLGVLYFLGLWYTVRRQATAKSPAAWLLLSVVGRLALLLAGFYLVMAGSWERLLACLVGFILARLVLTRRLAPRSVASGVADKEIAP